VLACSAICQAQLQQPSLKGILPAARTVFEVVFEQHTALQLGRVAPWYVLRYHCADAAAAAAGCIVGVLCSTQSGQKLEAVMCKISAQDLQQCVARLQDPACS
jgi:hypothetical protein